MSRITLVGINAKFAHTNPAIRLLKRYAGRDEVDIAEFTINMDWEAAADALLNRGSQAYGISLYIWNAAWGIALGDRLRQAGKTVFYGGPEAAGRKRELTLACDFVFTGEGEIPFRQWAERFLAGEDWRTAPGIAYREGGALRENPGQLADLDELPQPYEDLEQMKNRLVYYEASRGCPFQCSYCLSAAAPGVRYRSLPLVLRDIDRFIEAGVMKVKFVDRTFNSDRRRAKQIIRHIVEKNPRTDFHLEMAPDLVDEEMAALMEGGRKGLFRVELGLQSANPATLAAIGRRQDLAQTAWAVQALGHSATVHLDLIAGLPLEGYESFRRSFNTAMAMGPDVLQLGFLKVLKGSPMERDAARYGIVSRREPPYEVLHTDAISAEELDRLRAVEYALERIYNSGLFRHAAAYFGGDDALGFLERLSQRVQLKGCSEEALARALADYGREAGLPLAEDMVKLDRLLRPFRPKVKFPEDGHEAQRRALYQEICLPGVPKGKRPWHYSRIEWFGFDVPAYLEGGTLLPGECAVLFDYTGEAPRVEKIETP